MVTQYEDSDLEVIRGDDTTFTFSILSNSVGLDVSGASVYAQARSIPDSIFPIFDTRSTTGMAITDGSGGNSFAVGKIVLNITSAISKILPTHSRYDLRANDSGTISTLASGNIILKKDVSR